MNPTRCKMHLVSIARAWSDGARTVKFEPVQSGSEENKRFYAATPGGSLEFTVSAQAAANLGLDQGKIGSEFYIDITPAGSAL